MSREIKFRAWDQLNNRMIPLCFPTVNGGAEWISGCDSTGKDYFFMQYTGLKDKNGKEIYEGDILDWLGRKFPITINLLHGLRFMVGKDQLVKMHASEGVVIGNIYENPELLKETNQ